MSLSKANTDRLSPASDSQYTGYLCEVGVSTQSMEEEHTEYVRETPFGFPGKIMSPDFCFCEGQRLWKQVYNPKWLHHTSFWNDWGVETGGMHIFGKQPIQSREEMAPTNH